MISTEPENSASFGYRDVAEGERQGLVNQVFATVAERYDLMNDLMSGGLHRLWKRDFITWLNPPKGQQAYRLLDVAGGTGDIALRYAAATGPNASATICDISPEMLAVGRRRVHDAGLDERITCIEGNAETLPFEAASFDAYTIAFGIRNVTHIDRALSEAQSRQQDLERNVSDLQKLLKNIPDDRLKVHIVWLPMFPGDSSEWAKRAPANLTTND